MQVRGWAFCVHPLFLYLFEIFSPMLSQNVTFDQTGTVCNSRLCLELKWGLTTSVWDSATHAAFKNPLL